MTQNVATDIIFRPASNQKPPILVGLGGMSRSGKTLSAHRIARGIADVFGTKVAGIDTEAGRMLEYGPGSKPYGFEFEYCQLNPPFTGERYVEAMKLAEDVVGPNGVIICDSMSHEHEGTGGVLEQHSAHAEALAKRFNKTPEKFSGVAWGLAKEGRKKLLNYVRSERKCHLVMCFRAEEKTPVLADGRFGQPFIGVIGWQGWPFEMSVWWLLDREQRGVEIRHDTTASLEKLLTKEQLSEKTGRALAEWFRGTNAKPSEEIVAAPEGAAQSPKPTPASSTPASGAKPAGLGRKRAEQIMAALRDAPNVEAIDDTWSRLAEEIATASLDGQRAIKAVYDDTRSGLEAMQPGGDDNRTFQDEIDALEPDEWKQAEGREDERQEELLK